MEKNFRGYKELSKTNWGTTEEKLNLDQINTGAMLRIADATEKMAGNYIQLQNERDRYIKWFNEECNKVRSRDKQISTLRGQLFH